MVTFKKKVFSKQLKVVGKYLKDHPVLPISAASLGVGVANYVTNTRRRQEGISQHKEQVKVLKDLNNNILKNSEALNAVNNALKDSSRNIVSIRDKSREEVNKSPRAIRGKIKSLFKKKEYSIQDGGFKGRKVEPKKSSVSVGAGLGAGVGAGLGMVMSANTPGAKTSTAAAIGAIFGAGVGALAVWLDNMAKESIFNQGLATKANSYTLIKSLETIYLPEESEVIEESKTTTSKDNTVHTKVVKKSSPKSTVSPIGTLFSVDGDPKKYIVNLLLRGNVLLILLNKPNTIELRNLNMILDKYCTNYKLADYSSTKLDPNIYLVEVNIVGNTAASIVYNIIESGIKVNILTTDRFGIKNI